MDKIIINHWAFRILAPIVFAFFVYVLILLFFDSALQLLDNLISVEYFICLVLCFINFEVWRYVIKLCNKYCSKKPTQQLIYQVLISLALAVFVTGLLVSLYFKFFVGLVSFGSELFIFCSLFGISALLFNMVYISQFLLNYQHSEIILEQEKLKKEAVNRWQRFQNKINPNLLYQSLEKIIGLAHNDIDEADELLIDITNLYRQVLDNQQELITIEKEVQLLDKLAVLLGKIHNKNVNIIIDKTNLPDRFMIPGFLVLQIQSIVNQTIVNELQPLKIEVKFAQTEAILTHRINKKLFNDENSKIDLTFEINTLKWYTQKEIVENKIDTDSSEIRIPLINLDNR